MPSIVKHFVERRQPASFHSLCRTSTAMLAVTHFYQTHRTAPCGRIEGDIVQT